MELKNFGVFILIRMWGLKNLPKCGLESENATSVVFPCEEK
jgi:hypothetical protein